MDDVIIPNNVVLSRVLLTQLMRNNGNKWTKTVLLKVQWRLKLATPTTRWSRLNYKSRSRSRKRRLKDRSSRRHITVSRLYFRVLTVDTSVPWPLSSASVLRLGVDHVLRMQCVWVYMINIMINPLARETVSCICNANVLCKFICWPAVLLKNKINKLITH